MCCQFDFFSDCYLQVKVEDNTKLTLNTLWNPRSDNSGLNCTLFIVPKKNFGLEIALTSLSVYGMRDICKGRYLQFTKSSRIFTPSKFSLFSFDSTSGRGSSARSTSDGVGESRTSNGSSVVNPKQKYLANNSNYNKNSNFVDNFEEVHASISTQQLSPLEKKFCGKLEDYSESERTLTFPSSQSALLTTMLSQQSIVDNEIITSESSDKPGGVYLTVKLPASVRSRETFAFDLTALSPCQRVTLNGLDGHLKYSKHYENDQCSVVIHVPYGNTILTQIAVSRSSVTGDATHLSTDNFQSETITTVTSLEDKGATTNGVNSNIHSGVSEDTFAPLMTSESTDRLGSNLAKNGTVNWDQGVSWNISHDLNYTSVENVTMSQSKKMDVVETLEHESQVEMYDSTDELVDNSVPISTMSSYECPANVREVETNDIDSENPGTASISKEKQQMQKHHKYLLIQALDLVSGSEFNWCFDASKQNSAHKRAWKSSGNRVSINFKMSHFDTFVLTYESMKIAELAGDCERGWIKLEGACVTVMETPLKWTDAEESCQMKGGHLATIRNDITESKLGSIIVER